MVGMRVCRRWGEMLRACSASMRGGGISCRVTGANTMVWAGTDMAGWRPLVKTHNSFLSFKSFRKHFNRSLSHR